jgi:broad specificity phosphatase PhoE
MPTVWFIRHGESISNANMVTESPASSQLTPKGHLQAEHVVLALTQRPELLVVSPYVRTRQTAVPTIEYFKPVLIEEWPIHEYTYLHPKRYDGTRGSERADFARAYWDRCDPFEKEMNGGESFAELLKRVEDMIARLRQQPEQFVVMFSHGLFIRTFMWMQFMDTAVPTKGHMARFRHFIFSFQLPNTAIVKTYIPSDGPIQFHGVDFDHLPRETPLHPQPSHM